MLAIEYIAYGAGGMPAPEQVTLFDETYTCAITGKPTSSIIQRKKVFSSNFTGQNLLLAPSSEWVDKGIAQALSDGHLRWNSWISQKGKYRVVKKPEIRALVMNGATPPWAAYAAEDMRRHGGLITPLNSQRDGVVQIGVCKAFTVGTRLLYPRIEEWSKRGFGRKQLAALEAVPVQLKNCMVEWYRFTEWAQPYKESPEWTLAVWMLPTKEEQNG